jgi:polysaccharide export outer membrane protein
MVTKRFGSLLLALVLAPQPVFPQTAETAPSPDQPTPDTPPAAARSTAPEGYIIGSQDQLRVTVFGESDLSTTYRVDDAGQVTFPLIGRIMAGGLTLGEFQDRLLAQLGSYIRNPQVRVDVDQFKSQSVMVVGEVRAAGKIPMTGPSMTLLEALVAAGSPTAQASNEIIVRHRPLEAGREGEEIRVNRKDLELGKKDVALRDGDIINVPTAQRFYMSGYVRNPGFYVLDPGMTVEQAIALAGGLTDRGASGRVKAKRMVNGKLQSVAMKLEDKVQPNDTIDVPARFF